jgi:hypothetical protein
MMLKGELTVSDVALEALRAMCRRIIENTWSVPKCGDVRIRYDYSTDTLSVESYQWQAQLSATCEYHHE